MADSSLTTAMLLLGAAFLFCGAGLHLAYGAIVPYARDPAAQPFSPPAGMVAVLMKFVVASRVCLLVGAALLGAALASGGVPSPIRTAPLPLTLWYAAALGLLLLLLSWNVLRHRVRALIETGSDKTPLSERISRVHGNFTEYVPTGLLLLALLEWAGAATLLIHIGGVLLCTGRYLHAWGYSRHAVVSFGRIVGIQMTLFALAYLVAACLFVLLRA